MECIFHLSLKYSKRMLLFNTTRARAHSHRTPKHAAHYPYSCPWLRC